MRKSEHRAQLATAEQVPNPEPEPEPELESECEPLLVREVTVELGGSCTWSLQKCSTCQRWRVKWWWVGERCATCQRATHHSRLGRLRPQISATCVGRAVVRVLLCVVLTAICEPQQPYTCVRVCVCVCTLWFNSRRQTIDMVIDS